MFSPFSHKTIDGLFTDKLRMEIDDMPTGQQQVDRGNDASTGTLDTLRLGRYVFFYLFKRLLTINKTTDDRL
jgi:hypothetical protein